MTKDRLLELISMNKTYEQDRDIHLTNHFAAINMEEEFMPNFFDKVNFVRTSIDKLTQLVKHIEDLQHTLLTSPTDFNMKSELCEKMTAVRSLSNNIRKNLRDIKEMQEIETPSNRENIRYHIVETNLNVMTKLFCDIMNRYYASEIKYREEYRTMIARQLEIAGIKKNYNELEELLEHGFPLFHLQTRINQQQTKQMLNAVEERHSNLLKLEYSIQELNNMWNDFAILLETQGFWALSIEECVSRTYVQTGIINIRIREAIKLKRSTQPVSKEAAEFFFVFKYFSFKVI